MTDGLYIGLMSGTSVDGIDAALVSWDKGGRLELRGALSTPLDASLTADIHRLSDPEEDSIDLLGTVDHALGTAFAEAALSLLDSLAMDASAVAAIGSHGQTVRHRPDDTRPFTLQIGDPNRIAELTGICTVADFRRRDMAAGGQGAPLVPAFHAAAFGERGKRRAIVNIGGIANVTLLDGAVIRAGFDTGPGNTLLDHWTRRHRNEPYDRNGAWSAEGEPSPELLAALMAHPFIEREGPRSTGREAFNLAWLDDQLAGQALSAQTVQATLAEFTAASIAKGIGEDIDEVFICGGGASNADLMRRLYRLVQPATLATTGELGLAPEWVEAAAFAWLAKQALAGRHGNAPAVTGASGPRVLGAIYPGAE